MKLTKNPDPDRYGYSGLSIGFDTRSNFSINCEWGKIFIIFSVENSLSVYTDNRKKMSYFLRKNQQKTETK